jgi:hypothetical protein
MAIEMASKHHAFFIVFLFPATPCSRWGNKERVVARWRCPVASGIAMNPLHQEMRTLSFCLIRMTIEMARDGGTFVHCRRLFCSM